MYAKLKQQWSDHQSCLNANIDSNTCHELM